MQEPTCLVAFQDISKRFPGVLALNRVSFSINRGEIHAILGENGTGKSTLMNILFGIHQADEGEIYIDGEPVRIRSPHDALEHQICMIHQELSVVPTLTVEQNIWLGREKAFLRGGLIDNRAMSQRTKELFAELGVTLNPKARVESLSVANAQLVEIARAVSYQAKLLIMDEPTSALSNTEVESLFCTMRSVAKSGTTIIFISHKLEEVFSISDRITVLRDGCYIDTIETEHIDKDHLIRLIVGRELSEMYPKLQVEIGETVLEADGIATRNKIKNVSFKLHRGEILGICGLMGSGRTEVLRALYGIDEITSGSIRIKGKPVKINSQKDAIRNGMVIVTEDRLNLGIIACLSCKYNLSLAKLSQLLKAHFFIDKKRETLDAQAMVEKLEIKVSGLEQLVSTLSGGNQQKVLIGRALLLSPDVLLLDEPTRGIDVGCKAEIHREISKLASQGMAIVMVSSELPEILGMSDNIIVMRGMEMVAEFNRAEATQESLIKCAFGA